MTKVFRASVLVALTGTFLCSTNGFAKQTKFEINDPLGRDSVSFTSNAPIEVINGHTRKITGSVTIDDSLNLEKQPIAAEIDVDLASIDTGIALRNEHMRERFLETKKFPTATFKLKSIVSGAGLLKDGQKLHLKATGDFTVHGKTVQKVVPIDVTYFKQCPMTDEKYKNCDLIQISSTFPVPFKDHDIQRPEIVFQKLADTVFLTVNVTAHRAANAAASSAPATKTGKPETKPATKSETKPATKSETKPATRK